MSRNLPPLRAARYFEALAESEDLAVAAEELNVTKGAISQQIRVLEQFLGVALFDRTGRGLRITDAGQRYHSAVRASMSTLERATEKLRRSGRRPTLSITVLPAFASMWLVHRLGRFQLENPNLDIEMSADAAVIDFSKSNAHIGIRYASGTDKGLSAEPLLTDQLFPVCSRRYRDTMNISTPEDLTRCCLLHDTFWRDDWWAWLQVCGITKGSGVEALYFSLYSNAIDAARAGAGVAIGHQLLVKEHLKRKELVRLFDVSVAAVEPYCMVWPQRTAHLDFAKKFRSWIHHEINAGSQ